MAKLTDRVFDTTSLLWSAVCALGGAALGAAAGYGSAGIVGAIAVGFCGLILGALLREGVLEVLLKL